jgi:hypothetical protein
MRRRSFTVSLWRFRLWVNWHVTPIGCDLSVAQEGIRRSLIIEFAYDVKI